ncbi:hypothetical protein [Anditalea andensis]|uniref:Uncharacterized protein n=1 Tax=Anditalea andensis TaxID=1048983 RepID=A0A074LPF5_9BACT|nr:hypothetical protein [Anditalea andensis]KEO75807.1 hypothetical protein EL17_22550 [Anditalea andensis]
MKIYLLIFVLCISFSKVSTGQQDHRDDFDMNAIGGGAFRDYISAHITEDDLWATSMKKFGTFHSLMHEMMSELARYNGGAEDETDMIPDFTERISGGEWTAYRKNIEKNEEGTWKDFVQQAELMHDRVHQAMFYAVMLDNQLKNRGVNITEYADEDRAPYDVGDVLPELHTLNLNHIHRDSFRDFVWHSDKLKGRHLHAAMHLMMTFDEMRDDLINIWAQHANKLHEPSCAGTFGDRIKMIDWDQYSSSIENCADEDWKAFVKSISLMQNRINQMMDFIITHIEEK